MDRILATHTGSLIRPPELLEFLAAKARGEEYAVVLVAIFGMAAVRPV